MVEAGDSRKKIVLHGDSDNSAEEEDKQGETVTPS